MVVLEASTASRVSQHDLGPDPSELGGKPRPTLARGTGRHTNLAFPTPGKERRMKGGGAEG